MQHKKFNWQTQDGLQLYAQSWRPDTDPKAIICLVHGLGEHSGRYTHLVTFFVQAGYGLMAFDLRGHGRSEGRRGYAPNFQVIMDDIAHLLQEAATTYPDRPRFLYGHSLGGNLVLGYSHYHKVPVDGVIATGPSLRTAFEPPAWKIAVGKLLYRLYPTLAMGNEIDVTTLSRDPDVVQAYVDDPLVHDRLTARMAMDLLQSGLDELERAAKFPLPLLIMHGGADGLTSAQATREFAARAGDDCTLKIWEGFYHEIHNEPEQDQVFAYVLQWLEARV